MVYIQFVSIDENRLINVDDLICHNNKLKKKVIKMETIRRFQRSLFLVHVGVSYACGAFGGVINSLVAILIFKSEFSKVLQIHSEPDINQAWLYERIFWGALWGLLFALPFVISVLRKIPWPIYALGCSLIVAFANFLYFLPFAKKTGFFGTKTSDWFWVLVLLNNIGWGLGGMALMVFVEKGLDEKKEK
jgi:hypothetical protein